MRRTRTTKSLSTRHDRNYFKAWTPLRRLKVGLALTVPLVALFWVLISMASGDKSAYASGPISRAHAVFAKQCSACHSRIVDGRRVQGFVNEVSDEACQSCHNTPIHQQAQLFTPKCSSCHVEHIGSEHLERTSSTNCLQCHSNLKTKTGEPMVENNITGFDHSHPEFSPLRPPAVDKGTVAFNHAVHLKATLKGPDGVKEVQLECNDCHRVDTAPNSRWRFGSAHANAAMDTPDSETWKGQRPHDLGLLMSAATYDKTCVACHTLQFDKRFNDPVPHDKPEVVHQFVEKKFTELLANQPNAWREPVLVASRNVPEAALPAAPARSPQEWLKQRVAEAENLLWRKTCKQCHQISFPKPGDVEAWPKVAPSRIQTRWLPRSVFAHEAHMAFTCESCHTKVRASKETTDVLLPSVQTCQQCHKGEPGEMNAAPRSCYVCHVYHDWQRERKQAVKPGFDMKELLGTK